MGLTNNQMNLIKSLAENRLADAKAYAKACCDEDTTQKNAAFCKRYKSILDMGQLNTIEVPYNIKGMAVMENVETFREDRYYLSTREKELFDNISNMNTAALKLMEMGIPYLNAILLIGISGTGKTTFAKYVAKKLNLPFLYINFSWLIDSYMGKTSQNLRNVFDFARANRCLLMLDEIDCIARKRSNGDSSGTTREFANTTISLLQELDSIKNDSIIMAATNIPEAIDPAINRRFPIVHEIKIFNKNENEEMIRKYMKTIDLKYNEEEIVTYAKYCSERQIPQAITINNIIRAIANAIINQKDTIEVNCKCN